MGLYERIKDIAKSKGYSINKLEKELGFARSSINKFNTNKPSIEKIQQIADFLDVSVDTIMGKDNSTELTQERVITKSEIINLFAGTDSVIEKFFGNEQSTEDEITLASDAFVRMCKELIQSNKIGDVIPMNSETAEERRKTRSALADWLKKEHLLDGLYFDKNDYTHEELSKINEYATFLKTQRKPLLNAAHQRTDVEAPEGTDTSDNDIMDDKNF